MKLSNISRGAQIKGRLVKITRLFLPVITMLIICCNDSSKDSSQSFPSEILDTIPRHADDSSYHTVDLQSVGISVNNLISETRFIMNLLNYEVRPNIRKDGPLIFKSRPINIPGWAQFSPGNMRVQLRGDPASRYYPYPSIQICTYYDSVLTTRNPKDSFWYFGALQTVVHEITHYCQTDTSTLSSSEILNLSKNDYVKYVNIPDEFEAFSVAAYYFLSHTKPSVLSSVWNDKRKTERKRLEIIIDAAELLQGPKSIFGNEKLFKQ